MLLFCNICKKYIEVENLKFLDVQKTPFEYELNLLNCICGTTLCQKVYKRPENIKDMINKIVMVCDDILDKANRYRKD